MKIHIFEVEDWERDYLARLDEQHELALHSESFRPEKADVCADAEAISTFIYSKFTEDALRKLENLKLIATRSTGFDHIPTGVCEERNITVCNVPSYGKNTVAEHVFGLLLTLSHNLESAVDRTRKGDFSQRGLQGFDLAGKTMGIVGTGDIGIETVRIARGFSMEVIAFDIAPNEEAAEELGFRYVDMDRLLRDADIVSLHVPSNEKTRHLLNTEAFNKMKDGAVLINTSRGDLIDTKALLRALGEGKLRGAGLDVLPEEPTIREEAELLRSVYEARHSLDTLLADHVLVHMRNVIVTPHSAFNTREAVQRILDTTMENIEAFAAGEPVNVVG